MKICRFDRERGFISIEILIALIVVALLTTLGIQSATRHADSQNYQVAAQQQQQVADAAAKYLKDNFATVYASAGTTTPAQITTTMLRNTNYLPASFADANAFGQAFLVLARRVATNQLESIVITTGGQVIDEIGTREIAENLGASGGFIPVSTPTIVQGLRGGWSLALSNYGINPGTGHTVSALFLQDGTLANDYLYRNAIAGKPELNRMNTALNMGGNDINNGANITLTGNLAAGGQVTASGNVTSGATVQSTNLVATQTVKAATADISGETYTGGWFRTRGDGGWYSEKWGGGWYMVDSDWVRAYAGKRVYTPGQLRGGTVTSEGRTTVGEYLQLNGSATKGQSCNPDGLVSRDGTGILVCISGVWTKPGSSAGSMAQNGYWCDQKTGYTTQWGVGPALGTDTSVRVNFPIAVTASFSVVGSAINTPSGTNGPSLEVRNLDTSGFIMGNDFYPAAGFYWVATGYSSSCN